MTQIVEPFRPATPVPDVGAATRRGRYEFLDAVRGIAAMLVVVQHSTELLSPWYARLTSTYFRPGEFGVVLFFLCSGFIIPASLERHGSQSRFWVGRFFRLYPLYWSAVLIVVVMHFGFNRYYMVGSWLNHPVRTGVINATMLQGFLNTPNALGQSWTLAYELAFYGATSALFAIGGLRRSLVIALVGFVTAAFVGTQLLPARYLEGLPSTRVRIVALIAVAVGALAWRAGRRVGPQRLLAAAIGAALVPLIANRTETFNTAAFMIATLFFGTAIYRWTAGQLKGIAVAAVGAVAIGGAIAMNFTAKIYWLDAGAGARLRHSGMMTYIGAYVVFALAVALRRLEAPRVLIYLGTISYSVYLMHSIAIYGIGNVSSNRFVVAVAWIGATVVMSAITYRFIEKPAMDFGHRVAMRTSGRFRVAT